MIGTELGIATVQSIGAAATKEKFAGLVPDDQLEAFIENNFNPRVLRDEMNSMSDQFIVVYLDDTPAGYAKITSEGQRPKIFEKKTLIGIADFHVLLKFNDIQIKKVLFEKCLKVCSMQQIIWICEYDGNPDIQFFESYGFIKSTEITASYEFGLPPINLVKEKVPAAQYVKQSNQATVN